MRKPRSLAAFQKAFPDEAACAAFLARRRWPKGFICPECGGGQAHELKSRAWVWVCAGCRRQTSVTAGTVFHRTKLPLTVWFWAAHLMATHSNGISALQLSSQLSITYKTAWLLAQKLRRSMPDPDRELLEGVVEVDQTELPYRDGHPSYNGLTDYRHDPRVVGKMAAHIPLQWIHRVFSLMKRWGLGTYHGRMALRPYRRRPEPAKSARRLRLIRSIQHLD